MSDDATLLIEAVKRGDAAAVERLLNEDPSLAGSTEKGVSLVLLASYHGHPGLAHLFSAHRPFDIFEGAATGDTARVKEILAKDPGLANAFSPDGFPVLGLACFFGHPEAAELLIEAGADVNAAARNPMKVTALHAAATRGDARVVARLLAKGADPNALQQMSYTPLHSAAARGDIATVDILIAHGAKPEAKAEDGKTPADLAAERGHPTLAERLGRLGG
jgi:ankyrin repeat protein